MVIRFGEFELDEARFELRRGGRVIPVQKRVFETILYLAARAGRLVTREELASGPWSGTTVTDASIARAIKEARSALGDSGDAPSVIVTVRGVGFRFEAQLREPSAPSRPGEGTRRPSLPSASAFAGRERDLAELELAWSEARAGDGNLVLVVGPPGIGKTALVVRFFQQTRANGGEAHFGHCFEAQGTPPFWPWPELLRSYAERHGSSRLEALADEDLAELRSIVPTLWNRVDTPGRERAEGPYSAFRALDAVARFFRRAAERHPLALVLEDVHLADSAALDLIEHLQRSISDSKLLIVATCRRAEASQRSQLRAMLERALPHSRTIELGGLVRGEVSRWLDDAGGAPDARELAERVARATDGHPLLIANLLRALPVDFGAADLEQALARGLYIPERLGAAILSELERLDSEVLELVRIASVQGEEPWFPVLADLMQSTSADLGPTLDRALRSGVLERRDFGRLRFAHALYRELLYRDLTAERRLSLHAAAAVALSARLEDHPELVVEAAHHAMAASPCVKVDETIELLLKAAGWARRRLAFGLAAEHLGWALQTLDLGAPAPRKRAELLLEFAQSLHLAGRAEEAVRAYNELYELGAAKGLIEHMALALFGDHEIRREATTVDPVFHRRLSGLLERSWPKSGVYARLRAVQAVVTPFVESESTRMSWFAEARQIVVGMDDPASHMAVLLSASRIDFFNRASKADEMLPLATEFLSLAKHLGAADAALHAGVWRAFTLLSMGQGSGALLEVARLHADATTLGHPQFLYFPCLLEATVAFLGGHLASAEERARAAVGLSGAMGIAAISLASVQLAAVACELDGPRRLELFREALQQAEIVLKEAPAFEALRVLSIFIRRNLELEVVEDLLGAWRTRWESDKTTDGMHWLFILSILSRLACDSRDQVSAFAIREALTRHLGTHVVASFGVAYLAPVSYWLGRLDLLLGELEATEHFELAIVEAERACSRSWKAWAELGLAEALSKSERSEDLERARSLREGVCRTATELDLPRLLSVAEGRVAF